MKDNHELPASARRAFEAYPRIEPSPAFNRAVLDSLANAQSSRRQTFIGKIEEFLGVGLWSFAASGAMGAVFPAAILSILMFSGHSPQQSPPPRSHIPQQWPGFSPFGEVYRRNQELI